jgi:hypothetical protein
MLLLPDYCATMIQQTPLLSKLEQVVKTTMPELIAPTRNRGLDQTLQQLRQEIDTAMPDCQGRRCLHAGLWLLVGEWEMAHTICQDIPTPHGSAWHAVVHRLEGDFWNSKYWWRRAAGVKWAGMADRIARDLGPLPTEMQRVGEGNYDPSLFVDVVEAHHKSASGELRHAMVALQRLEWLTLFEECWIAASGQASKPLALG